MDIANNSDKEILVRHPIAARRAFTMIEMLVVISIIILLVGLGILAYAHIDRATTEKATRADLQLAQSFLDEYNGGPGISQLGMGADVISQSFVYRGGVFPAPSAPSTGPNNAGPIGGATGDTVTNVLTGNVSVSGDQRVPTPSTTPQNGPTSFLWDTSYNPADSASGTAKHNAVYNTAEVMVLLMRLPAVNQAVARLPSNKLLTLPTGSISLSFGTQSMPAPILVDGWRNPIIFVPAGGMVTKVSGGSNAPQYVLVRSSGIIPITDPKGPPPPLKDNDHPFWASAGPDGDFYGSANNNGGDDNIYSFQQ